MTWPSALATPIGASVLERPLGHTPAAAKTRWPKARWHKAVGALVSLAILCFIVVGVIPQFASYSSAWIHMRDLSAWWWVAIAGAAALSQVSGIWPYQAVLPGLRLRDGLLQIESATAISSTVPAGSAVAVGLTFKMFSSFGYSDVVVSTAVLTTGVWAFAVKIGLPIVAIAMLATTSHATADLVWAAVVGVVAMLTGGVMLWLTFRSETSAHWLGRIMDRVTNWMTGLLHKPPTDRIERSLIHLGVALFEGLITLPLV